MRAALIASIAAPPAGWADDGNSGPDPKGDDGTLKGGPIRPGECPNGLVHLSDGDTDVLMLKELDQPCVPEPMA